MTGSLINWGDEVRPDSVWSFAHLGFSPIIKFAYAVFITLSRDGSRRVMHSSVVGVINPDIAPNEVHDESNPALTYQGWAGMRLHAEYIKTDPGQITLMIGLPAGAGKTAAHLFPGKYMSHGVIGAQTRPVLEPVNPIPATSKLRDNISIVAAGWDVVWHSRYVFSDHLRQQVTSRIVDGLLANIERDIKKLLLNARPAENTYWKAKLTPIEAAAKSLCGVCAGDPFLWARVLARNIDLDAFRLRLDQGQVPAINMTTKPWQPGDTVAAITYPENTDVNAKKELAARWHDTNRAVVENDLIRWHDEELHDNPEPVFEAANDHFHGD